jgi:hypothetical protein
MFVMNNNNSDLPVTVAENGSTYKTIRTIEAVQVKVPRPSDFMMFRAAHVFESNSGKVEIPDHFRFGHKVPNSKVFVNVCFYIDLESYDELKGRQIVADVEIVQKTTHDGRCFVMLNVRPVENTKAVCKLKLPHNDSAEITGTTVSIPGVNSGTCISFPKL